MFLKCKLAKTTKTFPLPKGLLPSLHKGYPIFFTHQMANNFFILGLLKFGTLNTTQYSLTRLANMAPQIPHNFVLFIATLFESSYDATKKFQIEWASKLPWLA
jgi:hypothetical protein